MEKAVEKYFSSLNFICKGIMQEKTNFESLLGEQWNTLPKEEQDTLLDEHFIPPHIRRKYEKPGEEHPEPVMYPRLKIKSGQKIIEDDEGELWQDEHSGPFSWETSSQSEFCISDDMASNDVVKTRAKDPKRPKSPRLIKTNSGSEIPRPGTLERTGSTDFQQLRHIWETHHAVTPDSEMPPPFLSRSQLSLNGDTTVNRHISSSVENIMEAANEPETEPVTSDPLKPSFNLNTSQVKLPTQEKLYTTSKSATDRKITGAAPLATKEDDTDISSSQLTAMREDVIKMNEIKTDIEATMTKQTSQQSSHTSENLQPSLSSDRQSTEEDILKRFGVKFSYGEEEPTPTSGSDILATTVITSHKSDGQVEKPSLPSQFDFLTSW